MTKVFLVIVGAGIVGLTLLAFAKINESKQNIERELPDESEIESEIESEMISISESESNARPINIYPPAKKITPKTEFADQLDLYTASLKHLLNEYKIVLGEGEGSSSEIMPDLKSEERREFVAELQLGPKPDANKWEIKLGKQLGKSSSSYTDSDN